MGSQPTGGEPGGEMRKLRSTVGGLRWYGENFDLQPDGEEEDDEGIGVGSARKTRRLIFTLCTGWSVLEAIVKKQKNSLAIRPIKHEAIRGHLRILGVVLTIEDKHDSRERLDWCPCVEFAKGSEI